MPIFTLHQVHCSLSWCYEIGLSLSVNALSRVDWSLNIPMCVQCFSPENGLKDRMDDTIYEILESQEDKNCLISITTRTNTKTTITREIQYIRREGATQRRSNHVHARRTDFYLLSCLREYSLVGFKRILRVSVPLCDRCVSMTAHDADPPPLSLLRTFCY